LSVTAQEIREARETLRGAVEETPCLHSRTLSEVTGADVFLKLENLQFTASFKDRGAFNKLSSLEPDERRRGVIAMSAGNHAQAVAYHAQRMGIPALIVMPRHTPTNKVEHTRAFGAEVEIFGEGLDESATRAKALAAETGRVLVHPYDDPKIIAGQGTIGFEMLEAQPDLDALVVPVGGGGLVSGIAIAAKSVAPGIEIVGVETERYPAMKQVLAGQPVSCGTSTMAEGIAVKEPGRLTREIVREQVDEILIVSEDAIERAVLLLLDVEKTVVEGAGAVGLAALLENRERFAGRRVGLVVSGGNIDLFVLSSIIQRGLVRQGRLARLRVAIPDRPGALAAVSACISDTNASIVEVHHQRSFTHLPLESAEVEFVLQTRGPDHLELVVSALEQRGFAPRTDPSTAP
jgi:threonine dehydratase